MQIALLALTAAGCNYICHCPENGCDQCGPSSPATGEVPLGAAFPAVVSTTADSPCSTEYQAPASRILVSRRGEGSCKVQVQFVDGASYAAQVTFTKITGQCGCYLGGAASVLERTDAGTGAAADVGGAISGVPISHRAAATPCPAVRPVATCATNPSGLPLNGGNCAVDSDCSLGQNGRCVAESPNAGYCSVCSYDACFADTDCVAGGPCDCRATFGGANVCAGGNCRVDADCGPGGYCSASLAACPGYPTPRTWDVGYYCRTPNDTCVEDADCATPTSGPRRCRFDATAASWRCFDFPGCPARRPATAALALEVLVLAPVACHHDDASNFGSGHGPAKPAARADQSEVSGPSHWPGPQGPSGVLV